VSRGTRTMTINVRFHCTQAHARVARFLRKKTKGSGRARALLHHPADSSNTATYRSYTAFYDMCEQRIYAGSSRPRGARRAPRRQDSERPDQERWKSLGPSGTCVGNPMYGRDPRIRAIRSRKVDKSEVTEKVNIVIAARPEP